MRKTFLSSGFWLRKYPSCQLLLSTAAQHASASALLDMLPLSDQSRPFDFFAGVTGMAGHASHSNLAFAAQVLSHDPVSQRC